MYTEVEMNEAVGACQNCVEQAMQSVGIAIPWEIILDIFLELLEGCLNKPKDGDEIKAAVAHLGPFQRLRANRIARRHLPNESRATTMGAVVAGCVAIGNMDPVHVGRMAKV